MHVSLRPLVDADLDAIYEQMKEPESVRMAAFTAEDPADRHAFLAHMSRIRDDPSCVQRVIEAGVSSRVREARRGLSELPRSGVSPNWTYGPKRPLMT